MYGMSEKEFWEDDPQLYWAYHIFYIKKQEYDIEQLKYSSWLQGKLNYIAQSCALRDGFSKEESKGFPTYDEIFEKNVTSITIDDKNRTVELENNYWARF